MTTLFNGDMLQLARNRLGLTQKDLSEKSGIPQSVLSKIEIGFTTPNSSQIKALSSSLEVRPSFFEFSNANYPTLTPLIYRKRETVTQKELNRVSAIGNITVHQISKLLNHCDLSNETNLPFFDPSEYNPDDSIEGARQIARVMRQYLGIPKGPIKSMVDILENNGVIVFYRFDFPSKIDGFTIFPTMQFPYVFANADCQGEKIRMTLAHELGHIIMHRFETPTCEDEAWAFADEFLAPEEEFVNDLPLGMERITNIKMLFPLKFKWKISVKAMVKILSDSGRLSQRTSRYLYAQLSPYRKAEPYPIAIERPRIVDSLIDYCRNTLALSEDSICSMMGFSRDEYESWYGARKYQPSNKLRLVLNDA